MIVGVLAFDRSAALQHCLQTLTEHAGTDHTLIIHRDGIDPEVEAVTNRWRDRAIVIEPHRRIGVPASLNNILRLRSPGEDFCRVDGDVTFITDGWLAKLSEGRKDYGLVAPVWTGNKYQEEVRDFLAGKHRPSHIDIQGPPLGGVVFHPGEIVDKIGAYRNHGEFYGCQERDYAARVRGLGLPLGYISTVLIEHPPTPVVKGPRRWELEDALKKFDAAEKHYLRGERLYEELKHG